MSYCTDCIHYKVCENEGVDDSAMTFCADKQTDGDLISRQAVLDIFGDIHPLDYNARAYVAQIKELPSAEKTAEWTKDDECSNCGKYIYVGDMDNYCPHCGCKMKEVE